MGLGKRLLLLAATLVVFNFVLWGIPKIAPEVPERYEGVSVAGPPSDTPTTVPTSLPPGFPSMERPPPKIEVPDGAPQPIATKFGLTYEVPPGWDIWTHGVAKWTAADGTSATYGALGFYERTKCRDGVYSERVLTGMTGKRTLDLGETALTEVEKATLIFSDRDESGKPSVIIDGPENFMIDGNPAVRYHADVTDIPNPETNCTSNSASFDVVATTGHATAETAIFVVKAERGVDGAVTDSDIDDLISTIRKS